MLKISGSRIPPILCSMGKLEGENSSEIKIILLYYKFLVFRDNTPPTLIPKKSAINWKYFSSSFLKQKSGIG